MFVDINDAIEFTNIGTLFAFVLVSGGVIALRCIDPDRPRPFRCPGVPLRADPVDRVVRRADDAAAAHHLDAASSVWLAIGLVDLLCVRNAAQPTRTRMR